MGDIRRVRFFSNGEDLLLKAKAVGGILRATAQGFAGKVTAPSGQAISAKGGIGPRGAFGQVIMRGPGAVDVEFGSQRRPAQAPLRSAILGRRR